MSAAKAWLERSKWANRTERFGKLGLARGHGELAIVTMELCGPTEMITPFWNAWMSLPTHPALVQAINPGLLRYAAIDWRPAKLDPGYNQAHIARYGLVLCELFDAIIGTLGTWDATWFARPIVKLDLEHNARVAFVPPTHEDRQRVGVFVRAIGLGLEQLITVASEAVEVGRIIRRCIDADRGNTFQSIEELQTVFRELDPELPSHRSRPGFEAIEQGIGAYWLGKLTLARVWIEQSNKLGPSSMSRDLLAHMKTKNPQPLEVEVAWAGTPITAIDPLIASSVPEPPVPRVFQNAHDFLQPRNVVRTIEPALPSTGPVQQIEALLRRRQYRDALDQVDTWLASSPDDEPRAHHLRGKALLALGRLPDARAAFDRACTLRPQLLEAMLLRREVDRVTASTQAAAGIANPMALSLPDHLADLRDVLVSGRIVDAIQLLRRPAYDDDTVAQLLLAELLCTGDRPDDALAIYDRIDSDEARLGKARALVALDRPADALDALASASVDEAHELRSRALRALGRDGDAEAQMATYLRLIEQRSDRRIGSK